MIARHRTSWNCSRFRRAAERLSLEVIGYTGALPGSATSAALNNTGGNNTSSVLTFTLNAALASGIPSTYLATDSLLFTTTGTRHRRQRQFDRCFDGGHQTGHSGDRPRR